ncbi:intracellular serine protease [Botrytis cinerea]
MLIISRAIQPRPRGLSGWTVLFDWLRRNHVQKIMKVMVIDDGQTSHTDAAIEDALSGFEAELWDWKKLDLCSEKICNSSKVIREICLYSSENQAGLMSWSSTEGLRDPKKFPEARPLFFWLDQEDETRSREYIDTFKGKLNHAPAKDHGERIDFKYRLDNEAVSSASDFKNNEGAIQLRVHN